MEYSPYIWLLAGVLLMGLELLTPGFVVFFFGIGALMTGLLSLLIPGLSSSILAQLLTWSAGSLLSLFIFRRFFKKIFSGKVIEDPGTDEFVGQTAEVLEPITRNNPGRISFQGTTWKALTAGPDLAPGDRVTITKKDNLTFTVVKRE
jgi:inner membrane protein